MHVSTVFITKLPYIYEITFSTVLEDFNLYLFKVAMLKTIYLFPSYLYNSHFKIEERP